MTSVRTDRTPLALGVGASTSSAAGRDQDTAPRPTDLGRVRQTEPGNHPHMTRQGQLGGYQRRGLLPAAMSGPAHPPHPEIDAIDPSVHAVLLVLGEHAAFYRNR